MEPRTPNTNLAMSAGSSSTNEPTTTNISQIIDQSPCLVVHGQEEQTGHEQGRQGKKHIGIAVGKRRFLPIANDDDGFCPQLSGAWKLVIVP